MVESLELANYQRDRQVDDLKQELASAQATARYWRARATGPVATG
jgi:hypothetical protein